MIQARRTQNQADIQRFINGTLPAIFEVKYSYFHKESEVEEIEAPTQEEARRIFERNHQEDEYNKEFEIDEVNPM